MRQALPPGFASRSELKPALKQQLLAPFERLRTEADYSAGPFGSQNYRGTWTPMYGSA